MIAFIFGEAAAKNGVFCPNYQHLFIGFQHNVEKSEFFSHFTLLSTFGVEKIFALKSMYKPFF